MNDQETIKSSVGNDAVAIFEQIVLERRSVRGFRPDTVPESTMRAIFSLANRSPSNCNTQPWFVEVVSGEARDRISAAMISAHNKGLYTPDYSFDEKKYVGILGDRIKANAENFYSTLEIERHEKELRAQAVVQNLHLYGAPHAAFLFMPDYGNERVAADVGMYAQTLLLTMQAHGVSSCPQTILGFYADTVRELLGIDREYKLLFGISFGYEDPAPLANNVRTPRVELSESTRFHS